MKIVDRFYPIFTDEAQEPPIDEATLDLPDDVLKFWVTQPVHGALLAFLNLENSLPLFNL